MATAQLTVTTTRGIDDAVLVLTGEIDIATIADLSAAVEDSLQSSPRHVILDFAGVTFCDSQGLATLVALNRAAHAAGSQLVLAQVSGFMAQLFDITGLRTAFAFADQPN